MALINFEFLLLMSTFLVLSTLGQEQRQRSYGYTLSEQLRYTPEGYTTSHGYTPEGYTTSPGYTPEGVSSICSVLTVDMPTDWISMTQSCGAKMKGHLANEMHASLQYLALGAFSSRDSVNRPGFASVFFQRAEIKRTNAIRVINYLSMRGNMTDFHQDVLNLFPDFLFAPDSYNMTWNTLAHATESALMLESGITSSIRETIAVCEAGDQGFNDFYATDWLTQEFLHEQHLTKSYLAELLSELRKLESRGKIGEIMVDRKLQNGTLLNM